MNKAFTQWFLINVSIAVGFFWSLYFGVIADIIHTDVTFTCLIIFAIVVACSGAVGYHSYHIDNPVAVKKAFGTIWFFSEISMSLGLFGTVIGCILLFSQNVSTLDPSNQAQMLKLISTMSSSLGVAFYTTACGILGNMLIRLQVINTERHL